MNNMKRKLKIALHILSVIILLLILGCIFKSRMNSNISMTYNEVIHILEKGDIDKFRVKNNLRTITVIMKDGTEKNAEVPNTSEFISFISHKIEEGFDVKIEVIDNSNLPSLTSLMIFLCNILLILLMRKQMSGGKFHIGMAKEKSKVTFKDIAGIEEVQEQIEDIIDYLKNPRKYSIAGAKMPKGVLLSGEPGNGKTLLARAMSGEAGVEFFQVTGSSFEERLVGVGASRVRKLFEEAKRKAPAIVFIDEIDSIAHSRYSGKSDNEQTLNQLLAEMDGFESNDNIVVIAATNHPEILDPAILRPGRFDRKVYIPNPDVRARQLILELHARNKKISDAVSFKDIARKTVGFSGADLENILNEAAIYSVKTGNGFITNVEIEEAIARVVVGLKKKHSVMSPDEKHLSAIHESGHAVVSFIVRPEIRNFCISIVPRGKAGGYNFFDESTKIYQKKQDLLRQMKVLYGGMAAEEIILKDISSGASNDLEKSTQIAMKLTTIYGMNGYVGVKIRYEQGYNKVVETKAAEEIEKLCSKLYDETKEVVREYSYQIEKLASILEEKEYLTQEEVDDFMSQNFNL